MFVGGGFGAGRGHRAANSTAISGERTARGSIERILKAYLRTAPVPRKRSSPSRAAMTSRPSRPWSTPSRREPAV